jgi:P27 family predicted phage terminase small subunit
MPVPPKPGDRRQRRNTREIGPVAPVPARFTPVPPAPSGLLAPTRAAWAAFWASEQASLVMPADHPALLRLFTLLDERERCARAASKRRLIEGSQGQPVLNPLLKHVAALDGEIRQLEDRFGLTPLARLRLGVTFGEAHRSLADLNRALVEEVADDVEDDPRTELTWGGVPAAVRAAALVRAHPGPAGGALDRGQLCAGGG